MITQQIETPIWFQRHVDMILHHIRKGKCCVITGGADRGKSKILSLAADQLRASGLYHVLYHKLPGFDTGSSDRFFKHLSRSARQELRSLVGGLAKDRIDYANLIAGMVRSSRKNIVYMVDNLQLAPPNLAADLLGALLTALKQTSTGSGSRLIVVLCGTFDLNDLVRSDVSSFERFSERIFIDDLNREEADALIREGCRQHHILPAESGIDELLEQTQHDYYLINALVEYSARVLASEPSKILTPPVVHRAIDSFLLNFKPNDMQPFHYFRRSKDMIDYALKLLKSEPVEWRVLQNRDFSSPVRLSGLFRISDDHIQIKSELWAKLLRRHLTDGQIGRYYAMHSYWSEAIHYMGLGLHHDKPTCTSDELFRTVITAMYASDDLGDAQRRNRYPGSGQPFLTPKAVAYLVEGLIALFPKTHPYVYGPDFSLIVPKRRHKIQRDELEDALNGPEFSVSHNRRRLLIPLRTYERDRRVLGIIVLDGPLEPGEQVDAFKAWVQREELIAFIRQATAALTTKTHEIESVMATQYFASRVDALFGIFSDILLQQKTSEEMVLRLAAHAISAGTGLGFNRVIIFMKETSLYAREKLRVRTALGHLTGDDAHADWKKTTATFKDMDSLVQHVLAGGWTETPLYKEIAHLEIPVSGTVPLSNVGLERDIIEVYRSGRRKLVRGSDLSLTSGGSTSRLYKLLEPNTDYAVLPLRTETRLGVIYVDNKFSRRPISEEMLTVLQTFVRQVSMAVENSRAFEQSQREVSSLNRLLRAVEETSGRNTRLEMIERQARELVGADGALIDTLNMDTYPGDEDELRQWIIAAGMRYVNDLDNIDDQFTDEGEAMIRASRFIDSARMKSFIGLRLGDPRSIFGILYVSWCRPNAIDEDTVEILQLYARFAAQSLESAHSMKTLQERDESARAITSAPTNSAEEEMAVAEPKIKEALRRIMRDTRATYVHLVLNEPNNRWLTYSTHPNVVKDRIPASLVLQAFKTGCAEQALHELAYPLHWQGNVVAVLYLEGTRLPFDASDQPDFVKDFGWLLQILDRVDNIRLWSAQHNILQQLTRDMDSQDRLERIFVEITKAIMTPSRTVDAISLYYIDRVNDKLRLGGIQGFLYEDQHREDWQRDEREIRDLIDAIRPDEILTATEFDLTYPMMLKNVVAQREKFVATAVVPLDLEERRVGCVFFNYRFGHTFSHIEKDQMRMLAKVTAIAIYQAQLYDFAINLGKIATSISESLEPAEIFSALLSQIRTITHADNLCIVERPPGQDTLVINPFNFNHDAATASPFYHIDEGMTSGQPKVIQTAANKGLAGRAIDEERTFSISDTGSLSGMPYIRMNARTRSEIAVPIKYSGKTQAALVLESNKVDFFKKDDIPRIQLLASLVGIAMQNAERYKEERRRLAFNLLHDLRNSSMALPDEVDRAIYKFSVGESPVNSLEHIKRHALNVSRIVRGMAYFEEKEGRLDRIPISLVELLDKTVGYALYEKPERVILDYNYDKLRVRVRGDEIWLRHTVDNILLNAFSAIERKHVTAEAVGKVKITTRLTLDRCVEIFITDNGDGIEKRNGSLDYIFNPGYTTNSRRRFLSGVGLSACRKIIAAHDGKLTVHSRKNRGTTFVIKLPIIGFEEDDTNP